MANIFTDILKGMGKGMTQYGRNMGQRLGLVKLASRVKSVNPEDYATTEEYQRALNESNAAYRRLEQEMATPTYTALDKLLGISPEEVRTVRSAENVLTPQQGAKDILSAAPQVITGGVPAGLGLKGLPLAAGMGAARGGMGHIASSMPEEELENIGRTAGTSALLETLGYGAGEASRALSSKLAANKATGSKVSNKLSEMSDDLKTTAYKKKIGVAPTAKQGKYNLVRDSMNLASSEGRKINNADDLYQFSDELFEKYGDTANKMAQAADDMGTTVPTSKLIKPLQEKMKTLKFPEDRVAYQNVINQIKSATGGAKNITPSELLELRRQIGPKGNWNQLTPTAEQTAAKIWEEVYGTANKTLDETFSQAGISGFKDVNKKLATAIEQQNWARRALASRSGAQVWTDMAQDATMFGTALGSGPGGIAGFMASKVLQGQGENIAAGALDVGAKTVDSASRFGGPAVAGLLRGAGAAAQYATPYVGAIRGVEEPTQDQPMQQVGQPVPSIQPQAGYEPMQPQGGYYPGAEVDGYTGSVAGYRGDTAMSQGGQLGQLGQSGELKQLLAMGILSGEIKASDATAILSLLGLEDTKSEGKILPAGSIKALAETEEALNLLPELTNLLDEGSSAFGPLVGEVRSRIPWDKTGQKAKSTITLVRQIIGKGLEGGVLRKEDEYKYEQILPKLGDTEDTVRTKIALLEQTLQNKYRTNVGAYQAGGYNPWYGSSEGSSLSDILGGSSY